MGNNLDNLNPAQTAERIKQLESKLNDFELHAPELKILEYTYAKLVRTNAVLEPENIQVLVASTRKLFVRWHKLEPTALEIIGKLNLDTKLHREFINSHGRAIVQLTQIDAELTQLQHFTTPNIAANHPEEQLRQIESLEQELKVCEKDLEQADQLGLSIMQRSTPEEIAPVQALIDEYQMLWRDIRTRIVTIRTEIITRVTRLRQTLTTTVTTETTTQVRRRDVDSAVQVNTLPGLSRMTSITPKDAYIYELQSAVKECQANLHSLESAINDPAKKSGSQAVNKLISNSESSVELINHLSTLLITECFCTNEEAQVVEVAELSARFKALVSAWKSREQQQQDHHRYEKENLLFHVFFSFLRFWFVLFILFVWLWL